MAVIKKDGSSMGLPMNINRGNPIPIDTTSVWYSLQQAQTYAATGATAYVGQLITVVDEVNNSATVYVISNTNGDLVNISASSAALDDEIILYGGSASDVINEEEEND